jgi:hypothetical protein
MEVLSNDLGINDLGIEEFRDWDAQLTVISPSAP